MHIRRLIATAAVPLLLVAVGCSEKEREEEEAKKNAAKSCEGLLKPAQASAALPAEIPAGLPDATFYESEKQGETTQYFAYVKGTDIVATRDAVKTAFEGAQIEVERTDQEEGAEAELEYKKGSTEGSVQVIPYCDGYLRVRYRVGAE